jgi:dimethylargininase
VSWQVLVREVPDSYASATVGGAPQSISVDVAREQHAAYVAALRAAEVAVHVLPAQHDMPDSLFVEDTAVIVENRVMVTGSVHPVRNKERATVGAALKELGLDVNFAPEPASLDGGDVMLVGSHLYVGMSERTNRGSLTALRQVFGPLGYMVEPVGLPRGQLHLKCVCSSPAPSTVLLAEGTLARSSFAGYRVIMVKTAAALAANVVGVGDTILVSDGYPEIVEALAPLGRTIVSLPMGEIHKGDGALTCLSLRWRATPGTSGQVLDPRTPAGPPVRGAR